MPELPAGSRRATPSVDGDGQNPYTTPMPNGHGGVVKWGSPIVLLVILAGLVWLRASRGVTAGEICKGEAKSIYQEGPAIREERWRWSAT